MQLTEDISFFAEFICLCLFYMSLSPLCLCLSLLYVCLLYMSLSVSSICICLCSVFQVKAVSLSLATVLDHTDEIINTMSSGYSGSPPLSSSSLYVLPDKSQSIPQSNGAACWMYRWGERDGGL